MKVGIGLSTAVLILVVLALVCVPSTARGQVACGQLANGCAAGTCPDLFDAAGNVLGSPTCQQPTGEKCACVFTKADAACTIDQHSKKCKGRCDSMYRSAADARAGRNPVKGTCMQVAAGCQCVWKFR